VGFEDTFLRTPKAESSEGKEEIARLNEEESALEASSERKKKWRNLFLAVSVFAGSFAGHAMAEKNAFAGATEGDANREKMSSGFSYNQEELIREMEQRDEEIRKEMSPNRPYKQEDLVKFLEGQEAERKEELHRRAIERIKAELQKERDYSGIKNPSLRRSAEDTYKRERLGMKAIIDNPEKVEIKVIDENTILLSVTYQNPDTGLSHIYDYYYQLVGKK